ncbi:MAG: hypothetical protein EBZ69_10140 [Alphaproteobacteria bacterium]|nr:hypothetical protein [Alphaproteobacteria bacterium]NDC57143.1 hypothetical protein [Alphaproteobacteria bacterium]
MSDTQLMDYNQIAGVLGRQVANQILLTIERMAGIDFDFMEETDEPERLTRALNQLQDMAEQRRKVA